MNTKLNQETLQFLASVDEKRLTLGKYLQAIRQGEELTQAAFAKKLGESRQFICDIEHGRRYVSPKKAASYAKKLGYSVKQFVRLALADLLSRDGLAFEVELHSAA